MPRCAPTVWCNMASRCASSSSRPRTKAGVSAVWTTWPRALLSASTLVRRNRVVRCYRHASWKCRRLHPVYYLLLPAFLFHFTRQNFDRRLCGQRRSRDGGRVFCQSGPHRERGELQGGLRERGSLFRQRGERRGRVQNKNPAICFSIS